MLPFWKDSKSKKSRNLLEKSDPNCSSREEKETIDMKDLTVTFSTVNGHQTSLDVPSSKKFMLPRIRTFESTILEFKNIETAKSHLKETLKKYSTILFALGCFAALIAIIDSQVTNLKRKMILKMKMNNGSSIHDLNMLDIYTGVQVSSRSIISILSFTTVIYLYIYYTHLHTLSILRHIYPSGYGFWFTPLVYKFLFECIICLIHVPPGIDIFPEEAQLIVFSRFYLIGRFLRQKHKLVNSKSTRFLASVTKTELSSIFLLKTYFMRSPFLLIISAYLITVTLGGYGVYLVEQTHSYVDTIWMLVVTMTTVGFGDFVPRTLIARTFVAIIAVIGIFLMALCISLVHESLQLTQQEKRILAYVESTDKTRLLKETAATAIQAWWRYWAFVGRRGDRKMSGRCSWLKTTSLRSKLYTVIIKWRNVKMPQEDHWRKEFLGDNTAMMLTDVSREVKVIREFLTDIVGPVIQPFNEKNDERDTNVDQNTTISLEERLILQKEEYKPMPVEERKLSVSQKPIQIHENRAKDAENLPHISNIYNNVNMNDSSSAMLAKRQSPRLTLNIGDINSYNGYTSGVSPNMDNIRNDMEATMLLLQNQIRLMQGNLDDMYMRSKQDLQDLENIANCLTACYRNSQNEPSFCFNCRILSQLRSSPC